jgi:colanic acid biosynthesis glycosyl transferase WcaI
MVTSFLYYPLWRKLPEDEGTLWRKDEINGIPVHRCWHYVPREVTKTKRMVHEATFVINSFARLVTLPKSDLIIAISPPLLLGAAAWVASQLRGARYIFHVQDLQPDAAVGLGMLKPSAFTRFLYCLERIAYRHAWRVSGISRGMLAAFEAKGVPREKCLYFPNGTRLAPPQLPDGAFRPKHGFDRGDFLAVYSGNIGNKQGLEGLVEAARLVRDPRVKIVICGDGAQRGTIQARAEGLANVRLLSLLPDTEYRAMLAETDLAVITQVAGSGRAFFPSKLLSCFGAGRPVLSVADGESELANAMRESGGGVNVLPNQPEALAGALDELAADPAGLAARARAGRQWVEQFETKRVHDTFIAELAP